MQQFSTVSRKLIVSTTFTFAFAVDVTAALPCPMLLVSAVGV